MNKCSTVQWHRDVMALEKKLKHSAIQWLNLCEGKRPYFGESSNDLAELISVCFGIYTQTAILYFNEFVKVM